MMTSECSHLVEAVRESWGWTGLDPDEITAVSPLGHLIIKDRSGCFWHLDPEMPEIVSIGNDNELARYCSDPDFQETWNASTTIEMAAEALGPVGNDERYFWKLPPVLGGAFDRENLTRLPLREIVSFSGSLAYQIKDLPDGAEVDIKIVP